MLVISLYVVKVFKYKSQSVSLFLDFAKLKPLLSTKDKHSIALFKSLFLFPLRSDKRIILWNSYWQSKYRNSLLPIISLLDINSLQRMRKERYWATAYTKSLSIKGNFITGNNPHYYFSSQMRSENFLLHKNQDDFKFFREAIAFHGLEIEETETN